MCKYECMNGNVPHILAIGSVRFNAGHRFRFRFRIAIGIEIGHRVLFADILVLLLQLLLLVHVVADKCFIIVIK